MLKILMKRSVMEMRNIYWEMEGMAFCCKLATDLDKLYLCSSILWKIELTINQIEYLALQNEIHTFK